MALPASPNQISLGDIRTEFGLASGQIAMSSLYNKGNAPSSGEIQIGADFHGTSGVTLLVDGSVTFGQVEDKASLVVIGRDPSTQHSNSNIGSLSTTTNTIGLSAIFQTGDAANNMTSETLIDMTNSKRADIDTIKLGSQTVSRRGGQIRFTGTVNTVRIPVNLFSDFVNNQTRTIDITKLDDNDAFLNTTFTIGTQTKSDAKGNNTNLRFFNASGGEGNTNTGGTMTTTAIKNPENNTTITNVTGLVAATGQQNYLRLYVTKTGNEANMNLLMSRFRYFVITRPDGQTYKFRLGWGTSDFEESCNNTYTSTQNSYGSNTGSSSGDLLFNESGAVAYNFMTGTGNFNFKIV